MAERVGVQPGRICPNCGQENSVRVVWGLPSPDTMDDADEGLVELGGCEVLPDPPDFACRSCGLHWAL